MSSGDFGTNRLVAEGEETGKTNPRSGDGATDLSPDDDWVIPPSH